MWHGCFWEESGLQSSALLWHCWLREKSSLQSSALLWHCWLSEKSSLQSSAVTLLVEWRKWSAVFFIVTLWIEWRNWSTLMSRCWLNEEKLPTIRSFYLMLLEEWRKVVYIRLQCDIAGWVKKGYLHIQSSNLIWDCCWVKKSDLHSLICRCCVGEEKMSTIVYFCGTLLVEWRQFTYSL